MCLICELKDLEFENNNIICIFIFHYYLDLQILVFMFLKSI